MGTLYLYRSLYVRRRAVNALDLFTLRTPVYLLRATLHGTRFKLQLFVRYKENILHDLNELWLLNKFS